MSELNYRLTIYPDIDNATESYTMARFSSFEQLTAGILATKQTLRLAQDVMRIMPDSTNLLVSEKLINGEWEEILDL